MSQIDFAPRDPDPAPIEFNANQRRFPEKPHNTFRLARFRRQALVLLSEIITTPSLPCRVIRCGSWVRAKRKTSLNLALAVWSCQSWEMDRLDSVDVLLMDS